jgi:hypothetical protein
VLTLRIANLHYWRIRSHTTIELSISAARWDEAQSEFFARDETYLDDRRVPREKFNAAIRPYRDAGELW